METFGLYPQDEGRAGAGVAALDAVSAAALNPAAAALQGRGGVALSYRYEHLALRLQGRDAGVMDVHGVQGGMGQPFALGPVHLGVSGAVHFPDQFLGRISLEPPGRARFVMWEERVHRLVVDLVLAARIVPGLYVGGGVTGFAGAVGDGVTFRGTRASGEEEVEASVDVALPLRVAPTVGVLVVPSERWSLGLRVTGSLGFPLALDVRGSGVAGRGAEGDVLLSLRGVGYYTPAEVVAGVRFDPSPGWRVFSEVAYRRWRDAPSPSLDVAALVGRSVSPPERVYGQGVPGYRDILVPRAAVERDVPLGPTTLTLRAGYAFVPTPVPAQTGRTSYADADRHVVSVGASWALGRLGALRCSLHVALGWQHLARVEGRKRALLSEGGDLAGGGDALGGSLGVRFER